MMAKRGEAKIAFLFLEKASERLKDIKPSISCGDGDEDEKSKRS